MGSCEGLRRWASTAWATPPLHIEYLTFVHHAVTKPSDLLMMTIVSSAQSSGWPQPLQNRQLFKDSIRLISDTRT